MPRKISEIKEFTSKKSLENIKEDPAGNSLMGNIKKLNDELAYYQNSLEVSALRTRLGNIMDAHKGKESNEVGDYNIENIKTPLEAVYKNKVNDPRTRIADEKTRENVRKLIEYVAAGLDIKTEAVPVSDNQRSDVKRMEGIGRIDLREEQREAEAQARRDAVKGKSALNLLDEHKARVSALPKSFKGADAAKQEAEARKQLKEACLDIMAARRSIEAKRNDKSALAKAQLDADLMHSVRNDLAANEAVNSFLDKMSYSDLRKLAAEGHGGAMEDKLKAQLRTAYEIPANAPQQYMPTAKERIEALQDKMDTQSFRTTTSHGEQRKLYRELLAARAAVGAKRNAKETLNPVIDASVLDREKKLLQSEPLNTALVRLTNGVMQEISADAAVRGHGGALEDLVSRELRKMALEKDSGYKMQPVDMRYAPTYDERRQDLNGLMNSERAPLNARLRASIELGVLDTMQHDYRGDAKIANVDSINRQADEKMKIYSKVMDAKTMKEFVNNVRENGFQAASSKFELENAGHIRAVGMMNEIDEKLASNPSKEELMELAARKMVLLQENTKFQLNKNKEDIMQAGKELIDPDEALEPADNDYRSADEKLLGNISDEEMTKHVSKLMKSGTFKEMCEALGPEKLLQQAKGDGNSLITSYSKALDGTLKAAPAAEAGKNGPQRDAVKEGEAAGIQLGGK
ncbi:MAG: hypothetical protein IKR93_03940 [Firmicutes bacterium]|nr:hypothetical protein [Bacillota bacterium]